MKIEDKSRKAVNSPQVNKEITFHAPLLVESFCIVLQKYILRQGFRLRLVLSLFLIFQQISSSCSHKSVLIKNKECMSNQVVTLAGSLKPRQWCRRGKSAGA